MLRQFTSLVFDICETHKASPCWSELSRDDMSQLAVNLSLEHGIQAEIRCTAMPEWFQVECGPVNARVKYTRAGAESLADPLEEIRAGTDHLQCLRG